MNQTDNNLLTFLKKQSLFNSPSKNQSRKRSSRSRERNIDQSPPSNFNPTISQGYPNSFNNNQNSYANYNNFNNNIQRQPLQPAFEDTYGKKINKATSQHNFNLNQNYSKTFIPVTNNPPQKNLSDSRFKQYQNFQIRNNDERTMKNPEQRIQNNFKGDIWTGLVSYSTSFQSARVQSAQCLQNLSNRVRGEIGNINYKIQNFNNRMLKVISNEFKAVKQRIYHIIEETFKQSQKYIRQYMKIQQDKLAGDLIKMKQILVKEATQIQAMREEIGKPNWRKIAGQIIANQLQQKIDGLVRQSATLEVGRWQLGDLVGYRLKDLQKDLREVVRLKRDPVQNSQNKKK